MTVTRIASLFDASKNGTVNRSRLMDSYRSWPTVSEDSKVSSEKMSEPIRY